VKVIQDAYEEYDAMLLDVDNGPTALTDRGNSWLYTKAGLKAIRRALRPGGGAAIWSVGDEPSFERRLREAGLAPSTHRIRAHGRRGTQHLVFVGLKGAGGGE
jgi:spermidine synthase